MNIKIKFPNKKNDVEIQTSKEPINKDFFSPILSLNKPVGISKIKTLNV